MEFRSLTGLLLASSLAISWAKLPLCMKPCARHDPDLNSCALRMAGDAMGYVLRGRTVFGKLDALPMSSLSFNLKNKDSVLHIKKHEVIWRGLETTEISDFRLDLNNKKLSFKLSIPSMKLDGTCSVNGHIGDVGIYADGVANPYAEIHSVTDGYSATTSFDLNTKTNISGTFLVPVMTSHDNYLGSGTFELKNIYPASYTPGDFVRTIVREMEDAAGPPTRGILGKLISQLIPQSVSAVMNLDTYDQFFPVTPPPPPQFDPECAGSAVLTGGWLLAILSISATLVLK